MTNRIGWLALMCAMLGIGCATGDSVALEAQLLSLEGELDGQAIPLEPVRALLASRVGSEGFFAIERASGTLYVSACPLGDLDLDPYAGEDLEAPEQGAAPGSEDVGAGLAGAECHSRGMAMCDTNERCVEFGRPEIAIVEQGDWRQLLVEGTGDRGHLRVELRYREQR